MRSIDDAVIAGVGLGVDVSRTRHVDKTVKGMPRQACVYPTDHGESLVIALVDVALPIARCLSALAHSGSRCRP